MRTIERFALQCEKRERIEKHVRMIATRGADGAPVQVELCSCGHEGCADGGWLVARRTGERVVLLPRFAGFEDDALPKWAAPPEYLSELVVLEPKLASLLSDCALAPLRGVEVASMLQWEAPHAMLGRPGSPVRVARAELILAASNGDDPAAFTARIDVFLTTLQRDERAFELVPLRGQRVVAYLDGVPSEWTPIAIDGDATLAMFGDYVALAR